MEARILCLGCAVVVSVLLSSAFGLSPALIDEPTTEGTSTTTTTATTTTTVTTTTTSGTTPTKPTTPDDRVYYGGTYLITSPLQIYPGMEYKMSVTVFTNISQYDLQVKISLQNRRYSTYYSFKPVTIVNINRESLSNSEEPQIVSFQLPRNITAPPSWYVGYFLTVSSTALGFSRTSDSDLQFRAKNASLFIQTDKAVYKGGETVRMRTFLLDPELRPTIKEPFLIEVIDSERNKIQQWRNAVNDTGVIIREFPLSDQPVLGKWKIRVTVSGNVKEKEIEIKEYVLPKFQVIVNLPPFLLTKDARIRGSVVAKYTYGTPITGKANIIVYTCSRNYYYYSRQGSSNSCPVPNDNYWKRNTALCGPPDINLELRKGKGDFDFDKDFLLDLLPNSANYRCQYYSHEKDACVFSESNLGDMTYYVFANVTDYITGKVSSGTGSVMFKTDALTLSFMSRTPSSFKPGLTFRAYVQMLQPDGSPPDPSHLVTADGQPKNMSVWGLMYCNSRYDRATRTYSKDCEKTPFPAMNFTVSASGIALVPLYLPPGYDYVYLYASFVDKYGVKIQTSSRYVRKYRTWSGKNIQVSVKAPQGVVKMWSAMQVEVESNVKITNLNVLLSGRADIVHQQYLSTSTADLSTRTVSGMTVNIYKFSILIDDTLARKLAPKAKITVWYLSEGIEVVMDSSHFGVESTLQNKVTVKFNTNDTEPGNEVKLGVTAHSGSFVGVMAVDQSVLLMRSGNDITKSQVMSEMQGYINNNQWTPLPISHTMASDQKDCSWCFSVQASSQYLASDLYSTGIMLLTDAFIYNGYNAPQEVTTTAAPTTAGATGPKTPGATLMPTPAPRGFPGAPGPVGRVGSSGPLGPSGPSGQSGMAGPAGERGEAGMPGPDGDAAKSGSNSPAMMEAEGVRDDFPETWIWADGIAGPDGKFDLEAKAPDTITSWVASAFAISESQGLGVADTDKVRVFKPFFISLNLPYSVVRGEQFGLNATVFNYLDTDLQVLVTLQKSDEFDVLYKGLEVSKEIKKYISVKPGIPQKVTFWIIPHTIGNTAINVQAQSTKAADALLRILKVKPEGTMVEYTESVLIRRSAAEDTYKVDLQPQYPTLGLVPDSQRTQISIIGDLMGNAINNLDRLLRVPYGCGEQNMAGFTPNVYAMKYMDATDQMTQRFKDKAISNMNRGYQRQLRYKRRDGSFSAFGNSDQAGSTWLTSFVLRSFHEASEFISVDDSVMYEAKRFLLKQQGSDGRFNEPGRVFSSSLKGGSGTGISLTAYVLIALLEMNDGLDRNLADQVNKSVTYLERTIQDETMNNPYTVAIITYALVLAKSPVSPMAMNKLKTMAIIKDGFMYWGKVETDVEDNIPWWRRRILSSNIENTAYALLALSADPDTVIAYSTDVMKYMSYKQSGRGGYASSQDTVVGLQALSEYVSRAYSRFEAQNIDMQVNIDGNIHNPPTITKDNKMVLQKIEVPGSVSKVSMQFAGEGIALVKMTVSYYMTDVEDSPDMDIVVLSEANNKIIDVSVCFKWLNKEEDSGMGILELGAFSGYEFKSTNNILKAHQMLGMKRVEMDGENLVTYWDEFNATKMCMNVSQEQIADVSNLQQAQVRMYSYYNPAQEQIVFFLPLNVISIDRCYICPDCCEDTTPTPTPPIKTTRITPPYKTTSIPTRTTDRQKVTTTTPTPKPTPKPTPTPKMEPTPTKGIDKTTKRPVNEVPDVTPTKKSGATVVSGQISSILILLLLAAMLRQ